MFLIDEVSFILSVLPEVDTQVSQAILALIEVVAHLLPSDTVIEGANQNVVAASYLVFHASS